MVRGGIFVHLWQNSKKWEHKRVLVGGVIFFAFRVPILGWIFFGVGGESGLEKKSRSRQDAENSRCFFLFFFLFIFFSGCMARPPHNNPLSESQISSCVIFELFSIDIMLLIFKSMLLEYKILFVPLQHSTISRTIDASETSTTYTETSTITATNSGIIGAHGRLSSVMHNYGSEGSVNAHNTHNNNNNTYQNEHSRATCYDSGLAATIVSNSSAEVAVHANKTNTNHIPTSIADLDANFKKDKILKPFTKRLHQMIEKRLFDISGEDADEKQKEIPSFLDNRDYPIASEFDILKPKTNDLHSEKFTYPHWLTSNDTLFVDSSSNNHEQTGSHSNAGSLGIKASVKISTITSKSINLGGKINDSIRKLTSEDCATATIGTIEANMSDMVNNINNSDNNNKAIVNQQQNRNNQNYTKTDPLSIGSSDDFSNLDSNNPFSLDRIVYSLWFYIFLRTLQTGDVTTLKALHLILKVITQMSNESIDLADHWVFVEMVEAMARWANQTIKLIEVMNELGFEPTDTIYLSLLSVLTQHYDRNLELSYKILCHLPKIHKQFQIANNSNNGINSNSRESRARRNSLLNVNLKPETKRRKYYRTIGELRSCFPKKFEEIVISEECPQKNERMEDIHIRLEWTNKEHDCGTKCHVYGHSFDARIVTKEIWTYRVFLNTNDLINANDNHHKKPLLSTSTGNSNCKSNINNSNHSHASGSNSHSPTTGSNGNCFQRGVTHESTNIMLLQLEQSTVMKAAYLSTSKISQTLLNSKLFNVKETICCDKGEAPFGFDNTKQMECHNFQCFCIVLSQENVEIRLSTTNTFGMTPFLHCCKYNKDEFIDYVFDKYDFYVNESNTNIFVQQSYLIHDLILIHLNDQLILHLICDLINYSLQCQSMKSRVTHLSLKKIHVHQTSDAGWTHLHTKQHSSNSSNRSTLTQK